VSKCAQRKQSYYQEGQRDFNEFGRAFKPFVWKDHPLNQAYMRGFNDARATSEAFKNTSILQWFRELFCMTTND
jgi:hypothetical protein